MNRVEDAFLGGWSINSILTLQTGPFLTPSYSGGNDPSGTNAPSRPGAQRPDRLPASACAGLDESEGQVFGGQLLLLWLANSDRTLRKFRRGHYHRARNHSVELRGGQKLPHCGEP